MFNLTREDEDERPNHMVWDGTQRRAAEIVDWARDEALILFAAATPPAYGTEDDWVLKVRVPLPPAAGGGDTWAIAPVGATIRNAGTWVDPAFRIEPPAAKAASAPFATPPQE